MISNTSHKIAPHLWQNSCLSSESSLHQLVPYIGKMKSTMARTLVDTYSSPGDMLCDPFVGSGVVALECLIAERGIIASDINPYGITLTKAKIAPPASIDEALEKAKSYCDKMKGLIKDVRINDVPRSVRDFFHPKTLREILALTELLKKNKEHFLLSCLLGILHHQRPGFLSYPASHLVPYLRTNKFPKEQFPEQYEYRDVASRLYRKIQRTYRRFPNINKDIPRACKLKNVTNLKLPKESIDAVITSPPYMNALDYARDNRLRLWFLGVEEYRHYDRKVPNNCQKFLNLMELFLCNIHIGLKEKGKCVLVIGEVNRTKKSINTAQLLIELATKQMGTFECEDIIEDAIPDIRRARKNAACTKREWIVVLKKKRIKYGKS